MQLYIIRHAIALERAEWHSDDDLRPLTEAGIERMRLVASGLRAIGARLDALWASPLVRAQETAQIVRAALGLERVETTKLLRPDADPAAMPAFLDRFDRKASVGLVGHEPHVSALLGYLLTGRPHHFAPFKKGGVACLEVDRPTHTGRCTLLWLMQPKHLVALAAGSTADANPDREAATGGAERPSQPPPGGDRQLAGPPATSAG